MTHSLLGLIHLIAAFASMALGAVVLLRPKGGGRHRLFGYAYALAMLTVNATALAIYRVNGRFNFLHVFALLSLFSLLVGLTFAIRRRPAGRWLYQHYRFMGWSYIGLLAAFVAESSTRAVLPWLQRHGYASFGLFWVVVGLATAVVCGIGAHLLKTSGYAAAQRLQPRE
jgi:uncharacterized membrane protein